MRLLKKVPHPRKSIGQYHDRLCDIKALLKQGKTDSALLTIRSLESSLYQALAIHSLEQHPNTEQVTCKDYPSLVTA